MNPKFLALSLILTSVLFAFPSTSKGFSSQSLGPGKMTYVVATIAGGPQTVDPAMAYDTASGELIANVYDPLLFFKMGGSEVVPWLADSYTVSPDGLTYTFHIRPNVPWQNPAYGFVTPADVEYSFEKVMVRDYTGGPAWMFWFPAFNQFAADLTDPVAQGVAIDSAITRDDVAGTVTIHFQTGMAYMPFLGILAQTWASIQSKQWCIDNGDWNPTVHRLSDGTWVNAHDPVQSPLDVPTRLMMGSGPFKFNHLNEAVSWSILRNTNFWGGWGTTRTSLLGMATTSRGYVDEIVEYFISDYAVRLAGFTGPTPFYDNIAVPRSQIATVWQQPGMKQQYPLATQVVDAMFFNYDVGMTSPYIGTPTGYGYFGELGITPDFFSDGHVRRAVAYSFNWSQFILSAYLGEAQQVGMPLPVAGYEPYYNGSPALKYSRDLSKATAEWQLAWGGQVWANGFRFKIVYNEGNVPRQKAAEIIKAALEAQNPKFHVDVVAVPWNVLPQPDRRTMPILIAGWIVDYPDPDDWVVPFMSPTEGIFAIGQHLDLDPYATTFDDLIRWGARNTTVEGRNYNYQRLWQLYHDQAPNVPLQNAFSRRVARDWVHGWYFNPIFPGVHGYALWKENIKATSGTFMGKSADWEDITEDGKVDIKDLAIAAKAFGAYFIQPLLPPNPAGPPGTWSENWNCKADVNVVNVVTGGRGDMKVDIKDLATLAKLYGFVADPWTPGP
jgi:peptide/nickel transport system substrate-binding protein